MKESDVEKILDWKVLVWGLVPRDLNVTRYNFRRYMDVFKTLLRMYPIIDYGVRYDGGVVVIPKRFEDIWRVFFEDIIGFDIIVFREETIREHIIDMIETYKAWSRIAEPLANELLRKLKGGKR